MLKVAAENARKIDKPSINCPHRNIANDAIRKNTTHLNDNKVFINFLQLFILKDRGGRSLPERHCIIRSSMKVIQNILIIHKIW